MIFETSVLLPSETYFDLNLHLTARTILLRGMSVLSSTACYINSLPYPASQERQRIQLDKARDRTRYERESKFIKEEKIKLRNESIALKREREQMAREKEEVNR